jgi:UPF0755 protein
MRKFPLFLIVLIAIVGISVFFLNPFKAPSSDNKQYIFTVSKDPDDEVIGLKLAEGGFIRSMFAFEFALNLKGKGGKIQEGGYYLSKNMDTWKVIDEFSKGPDLKWVTVVPGMRKEQIGERLQGALGWSNGELKNWNETYTAMKFDYIEGVYFPDTYLIPIDESGLKIANRMINNFNEKFAPYQEEFAKKNIVWTTGLKLASLIQREAAGPRDMKLISGILWNRLEASQKLEIDATVQYAKGKTNGSWWSRVTGSDIRNIDSSYNTYKNKGLPPHPIANPGIAAIEASLNPQETDCFYYLHSSRQIYCSETYEEHLENIEKYLN